MNAAGDYSELKVRRALQSSRMLSSDVSAAYDPNYPAVMEKKNSAFFGKGLTFNKFTGSRGKSGSNDANAEYIARIRKILDENEAAFRQPSLEKLMRAAAERSLISWQTTEWKSLTAAWQCRTCTHRSK